MDNSPSGIYQRFMKDPMKYAPTILGRAKKSDIKGLPIPDFVAKSFIPKIESNPEPYLRSLRKVSPERVKKFIEDNPDLFKGVFNQSNSSKYVPTNKYASVYCDEFFEKLARTYSNEALAAVIKAITDPSTHPAEREAYRRAYKKMTGREFIPESQNQLRLGQGSISKPNRFGSIMRGAGRYAIPVLGAGYAATDAAQGNFASAGTGLGITAAYTNTNPNPTLLNKLPFNAGNAISQAKNFATQNVKIPGVPAMSGPKVPGSGLLTGAWAMSAARGADAIARGNTEQYTNEAIDSYNQPDNSSAWGRLKNFAKGIIDPVALGVALPTMIAQLNALNQENQHRSQIMDQEQRMFNDQWQRLAKYKGYNSVEEMMSAIKSGKAPFITNEDRKAVGMPIPERFKNNDVGAQRNQQNQGPAPTMMTAQNATAPPLFTQPYQTPSILNKPLTPAPAPAPSVLNQFQEPKQVPTTSNTTAQPSVLNKPKPPIGSNSTLPPAKLDSASTSGGIETLPPVQSSVPMQQAYYQRQINNNPKVQAAIKARNAADQVEIKRKQEAQRGRDALNSGQTYTQNTPYGVVQSRISPVKVPSFDHDLAKQYGFRQGYGFESADKEMAYNKAFSEKYKRPR